MHAHVFPQADVGKKNEATEEAQPNVGVSWASLGRWVRHWVLKLCVTSVFSSLAQRPKRRAAAAATVQERALKEGRSAGAGARVQEAGRHPNG